MIKLSISFFKAPHRQVHDELITGAHLELLTSVNDYPELFHFVGQRFIPE